MLWRQKLNGRFNFSDRAHGESSSIALVKMPQGLWHRSPWAESNLDLAWLPAVKKRRDYGDNARTLFSISDEIIIARAT
jgi:hypothetical protein